MDKGVFRGIVVLLGITCLTSLGTHASDLTFEERVKAQEAIERVYYSHQIGATKPFEEAVPRALIEKKVRTYLKESLALERFWHTPVTASMLSREAERIAAHTRLPERLVELYRALGENPFVVQECLARPILVDRMARSFFAYGPAASSEALAAAERFREQLVRMEIDPRARRPNRTVLEIVRVDAQDRTAKVPGAKLGGSPGETVASISVDSTGFERWRRSLPRMVDAVGPLIETRDAFTIRVLLEESSEHLRIATFSISKRGWEEWWNRVGGELDERVVRIPEPREEPPGSVASITSDAMKESNSAQGLPADANALQSRMRHPHRRENDSAGPSTADGVDDTWEIDSLSVPEPRSGHSAVWTGSIMIVWGGSGGDVLFGSGGRYDPAIDAWTPTSMIGAPEPREQHIAVWTGSRMIVWGGDDPIQPFPFSSGGIYDPISDTWRPTSVQGAPAQFDATAVWTGQVMAVWGGHDLSGLLNSGARYDPSTDVWTPTSALGAPAPRTSHTAVWTGARMIVWGGQASYGSTSTGGSYDPVGDAWSPMSSFFVPGARYSHSAVWTGSEMIIWGGADSIPQLYNDGGRYDPVADRWTRIAADDRLSPRSGHCAVWDGSTMIVWGGWVGNVAQYTNTGGRYDPVMNDWSVTATDGAPNRRAHASVVWTGDRMVVWGGEERSYYQGVFNSGGRYDPVMNTWTPTQSSSGPSPRWLHTAVWTGNQMVVWGGIGVNTYSDGGRYDPVIDSWTPTSPTGSPTPRYNHTAVWTGDRMIVWGGHDDVSYLNTGGRYDVISDRWLPTSIEEAPSSRMQHSAIWTGDRMVVWGGANAIEAMNSGGRYDPAEDSWTGITLEDAPAARDLHTAIWTGGRMLVWGGRTPSDSAGMSTGGRYDPTMDSWTPISLMDAPTPRWNHTAVWTGHEMLIWGGYGLLDTGGRYDPEGDAWTPISQYNAPVGRWTHTAIWTGCEMVVWGGNHGSFFNTLESGARYSPVGDTWSPTSEVNSASARGYATAVWTGRSMIVWGGSTKGYFLTGTGGSYVVRPADSDADGAPDPCDCAPGDATVFSRPYEVRDLRFSSDKTTLLWSSASPDSGRGTRHDVLRGALDEWPVGSGASEVCLVSGLDGTSWTDLEVPYSGQGLRYLIRGLNSCGTGTYGHATDGSEETSGACP